MAKYSKKGKGASKLSMPEGYNAEFIGGAHSPYGMPQDIIIKEWPKCSYDNDQNYDYGIQSIDRQMSADIAGMKKQKSKDRY